MSTGASEMRGRGWPPLCSERLRQTGGERAGGGPPEGGFHRMEVLTKQAGPAHRQRETLPHSCFPAIVWKRASLFRSFFVYHDMSKLWGEVASDIAHHPAPPPPPLPRRVAIKEDCDLKTGPKSNSSVSRHSSGTGQPTCLDLK